MSKIILENVTFYILLFSGLQTLLILQKEQVADLSLLRAETHKFESCYIDILVGTQ